VQTAEIVLLLFLLLALVVDGVLLARRPRSGDAGGARLRGVALVLTAAAVGLLGGYVVIHSRPDAGIGSGGATISGSADLQERVIQELQQHYYKPVDPAKLARVGGKNAIDAMLKTLNDPYTEYMDAKETDVLRQHTNGTYSGIGAVLEKKKGEIRITRIIEKSPASEAGLLSSDVIVSVDGWQTKGKAVEVVSSRIKGKAGTQVRLAIRRAGVPDLLTYTLLRREIAFPLTRTRLIDDHGTKVGYVQLYEFASGASEKVRTAVDELERRGAQRIILDLRYNGGGLLDEGVGVASDFLEPGQVVVTTEGAHSPMEVLRSSGEPATRLPVVVLVNHWTASASEIVSGALQDLSRATVIGTKTFGKGLVQYPFSLPGGATLKMTIAVYHTPRGTDINHVGIIPSITAKDNLKTKRDEALDRALRYIATGR
jgi:carboxyl-terminal processing protease